MREKRAGRIELPWKFRLWLKIRRLLVKLGILEPIKWKFSEKPAIGIYNEAAVEKIRNLSEGD